MSRLPMPDLPPSNVRDLLEELHSLHARAGWPSCREIAKGLPFSHTLVWELFTRYSGRPKLPLLFAVVEKLASLDPRTDAERIFEKFDRLWQESKDAPLDLAVSDKFRWSSERDAEPTLEPVFETGLRIDALTAQEREIVHLLIKGLSFDEIAENLLMGRQSLRNRLRLLKDRFSVETEQGLRYEVVRRQLIEQGTEQWVESLSRAIVGLGYNPYDTEEELDVQLRHIAIKHQNNKDQLAEEVSRLVMKHRRNS